MACLNPLMFIKFIRTVKNTAPTTNQITTIGIPINGSQKITLAITSTIGSKRELMVSLAVLSALKNSGIHNKMAANFFI